jgi:hypothetical protein
LGSTNYEGVVPVVNTPASLYENLGGNNLGNNAVVVGVTLTSSTGGLYANYGGNSVLLQ